MSYEPDTIEGIIAFCEREGQPCSALVAALAAAEAQVAALRAVLEQSADALHTARIRFEEIRPGWPDFGAVNVWIHEALIARNAARRALSVGDAPSGTTYREGFADGLRWVLERFNLDTEDEDALNEAIEKGPWE